jgi:DNA recombination protein RmuC
MGFEILGLGALLLTLLVGGLGFVWGKSSGKNSIAKAQLQAQETHNTQLQEQTLKLNEQQQRLTELETTQTLKNEQLLELQTKEKTLQAQHSAEQQAQQSLVNQLHTQKAVLETQVQSLQAEQQRWEERLQAQWKAQLEQFLLSNLQQIRDTATQDYEVKKQSLDENLKVMLKPLNETLEKYQSHVLQIDKAHFTASELIQAELKRLGEINSKLGAALSFNKGRGDWGELELLRLLEDSGLREGVSYHKQVALLAGKKRPDIRVDLPEGRSLFIDSKALQVDLNPVEHEDAEQAYLLKQQRALQSLKAAIKLLAEKEYQSELENGADFVLLFVPRESMLSLAAEADGNLFWEAYRQKVILASPMMLMALLRLVHQSWRLHNLSEDASEILKLGSKVYQQAATLVERYEEMGKTLGTLCKKYMDGKTSLDGQQGLTRSLRRLVDYGCEQGKKSVPEQLDVPDTVSLLASTAAAGRD